jgi:hypothetical protein
LAQEVIRQHAGHHGFADGHGPDADARIVSPLGDDLGGLARAVRAIDDFSFLEPDLIGVFLAAEPAAAKPSPISTPFKALMFIRPAASASGYQNGFLSASARSKRFPPMASLPV